MFFEKNQIYKNRGKLIMQKNEKCFLNSSHAALSSFQSSGRITADMRFAPRLGALPNCYASLCSITYIKNITLILQPYNPHQKIIRWED